MKGLYGISSVAAAAAAVVASLSAQALAQKAGNWTKVLMQDAVAGGAVCLDGSPGGFYIRKGDPSKWIVFHQGGGWCGSTENCYERSSTDLGSSKNWPPTYDDYYEGSELFVTPPFDTYTVVYAMYCDGGSWTGNATDSYNGTTIYYRGRPLLDALIDELLGMGLKTASSLLYAGCSAGGLTAYSHLDYVKSRMPTTVQVLGLADAMFVLEHDDINHQKRYISMMDWGYQAWNSKDSVNQACLAAYGGDGAHCMFGANVAPHVQTPIFVLNSKYDAWQQVAVLELNCTIDKCQGAELQFWVDYGHELVTQANALPSRHGAFITNCEAHCQTGTDPWLHTTVGGVAMKDAFVSWYKAAQSGHPEAATRHISPCDQKPCAGQTCGS